MPIVLNSNISALQAERRLSQHSAELATLYQRLSSGQRINRAADDAAGLSIASALNTDKRVFTQGVRNINDGASLINIAEGAIEQLENIVIRVQELAEQAANGTLGMQQRKALNAEAQALSKEYLRIARTTEFNGRKLFDGTTGELSVQSGYGRDGAISSGLGGKIADGTFRTAVTIDISNEGRRTGVSLGDLNGDGLLDVVTAGYAVETGSVSVRLGNGDGTFREAGSYASESTSSDALSLADLNNDGILDLVTAGHDGPDGTGAGVTVRLGIGDGTFGTAQSHDIFEATTAYSLSLGDLDGDGFLDVVTGGDAGVGSGIMTVLKGAGDGSFYAATSYEAAARVRAVALGDLDGDGISDLIAAEYGIYTGNVTVRLGRGDGTFGAAHTYAASEWATFALSLGDVNGDGRLDVVTAGYVGGGGQGTGPTASILLGNGNGTLGPASPCYMLDSFCYSLRLADVSGDGVLDMLTAGERGPAGTPGGIAVRVGIGDGTFGAILSFATAETAYPFALEVGDVNLDGVLDVVTAGDDQSDGGASVLIGNARSGVSPLLPFSLKTKVEAKFALELMKQKLSQLTAQRGTIGALQSRLQTASSVLSTSIENIASAESQIRDADAAVESARMVRLQILQQANAAILSQANSQPQLALSLLR